MTLTPEQLVDWFLVMNPEFPREFRAHWLALLASPPEGATRSQLISGMKQGINDTLSHARYFPEGERKKIDEALTAKGLPSIRKMDADLKKKHRRILARGHIKNDEEFYIVAEILAHLEFDISEADRRRLGTISYAYEIQAKKV